jgi:Cu(I)/Ag(I) efflux system membrane fusion protein
MLLLFLFATGTFFAGSWYNQHKTSVASHSSARKPLYYVDPMHPAYKSDKPGIAPDCGMQLEPVYAGAPLPVATSAQTAAALPPGSVRIDPARQQLFGVRVDSVEKSSGDYKIRLLGRVAPDEGKIYKLNAGIEGYIQEISAATTGSFVRKDEVLATFSAPSASMTLQTFVLNLGAEDRFKKSAADGTVEGQSMGSVNANLQLRVQQLQNLGMSTLQMDEIRKTRQIPDTIKIVSPVDGRCLRERGPISQARHASPPVASRSERRCLRPGQQSAPAV